MILRIALNSGGGKWIAGTVLQAYPDDHVFNWGDKAKFLLIKISNAEYTQQIAEDVTYRKKVFDLFSMLSVESLKAYEDNTDLSKEEFELVGKQPELDETVEVSTLSTLVAPPSQIVDKLDMPD